MAIAAAFAASKALDYSLTDANGKTHTADEIQHYKATVLLFVATECPNANTYAPVLARLYREYSARGVLFLAVYSDPADNAAAVQKHDADYRIPYPGLLDPNQTLARQTGARSTPEAVVLSPGDEVLYRGRVDDRFVDLGKTRFRPAHEDLREALDQILQGQPVKNPVTKVLGCAIPGVN
ncbi:MAG: redoxin domain-containing protein [Acidobacteriia bacterium]|nr:redoxin domain-containing protein [Terriglobia bacterium]